ncbi:MAG: zinc ribbon domain-containing protein [Dehalococcoidia bacterium]|nr:zinc ribbon domain-containing protein [Dehalococcoidia bacterium]MDD5494750.1 zinc ribbon domain-containing protein [Dehalococcoidia bacterium]
MPYYQYSCPKCKTSFEVRQSFNDESMASCPKCKTESRRIFLPVPIIFKGSGFYVTDSKKPSEAQSLAKIPETTREVSVPKEPEAPKQATV